MNIAWWRDVDEVLGTHTVTIRSAEVGDITQLVRLLSHGALVEGQENATNVEAYRAALAEIQGTPDNDVAEVDGETVGVCRLLVFRHFQRRGGRCPEIESTHVHPEFAPEEVSDVAELISDAVREIYINACRARGYAKRTFRPKREELVPGPRIGPNPPTWRGSIGSVAQPAAIGGTFSFTPLDRRIAEEHGDSHSCRCAEDPGQGDRLAAQSGW